MKMRFSLRTLVISVMVSGFVLCGIFSIAWKRHVWSRLKEESASRGVFVKNELAKALAVVQKKKEYGDLHGSLLGRSSEKTGPDWRLWINCTFHPYSGEEQPVIDIECSTEGVREQTIQPIIIRAGRFAKESESIVGVLAAKIEDKGWKFSVDWYDRGPSGTEVEDGRTRADSSPSPPRP